MQTIPASSSQSKPAGYAIRLADGTLQSIGDGSGRALEVGLTEADAHRIALENETEPGYVIVPLFAPTPPADADAWERQDFRNIDGDKFDRRIPRERIPALVKPGMVIEVDIDSNPTTARVIAVTSAGCAGETEDGRAIACEWGAVNVICAQPDPEFITK